MYRPAVFSELSTAKERLFDLQRLTQEAVAAAERGEPLPEGLSERLNALAEEQLGLVGMDDMGEEEGDNGGDDANDTNHNGIDHLDSVDDVDQIDSLADSMAGLSSSVRCALLPSSLPSGRS